MSSEKRLSHSSSVKQRKKSPCNLVIHHESPVSSPYQNGLRHSPSAASYHAGDTNRKLRQSTGSDEGHESANWVASPSRKPTSSSGDAEGVSHSRNVSFNIPDEDDVFYGSSSLTLNPMDAGLHRPVAIEEELYAKVNQLNSLVLLWRKRWKHQKEFSDNLAKQVQTSEQECSSIVSSIKEAYSQKLKDVHKKLSKEIMDRQKLEKDKELLQENFSNTLEKYRSEKDKLKQALKAKDTEVKQGISKQEEARITIKDIKKELSKVKRENEKLVRHIAKLRAHIDELEDKGNKMGHTQCCVGDCEHKLLFELAVESMKFHEENVKRLKSSKKRDNKYMVKTDPCDPLNISIESYLDSSGDVLETSATDVLDSLNSSVSGDSKGIAYPYTLESAVDKHVVHRTISRSRSESYTNAGHTDPRGDISTSQGNVISKSGVELDNDMVKVENTTETPRESLENCEEVSIKTKGHSRSSSNSDSALSGEGFPPSPHTPLRKCLTSDAVPAIHSRSSALARRKTWVVTERSDSPSHDSGNCSPCLSPTVGDNEGEHQTSTPRLARSGFEGLRERRNGIIDMNLDLATQLKFSKGQKKGNEFTDILKKFTFLSSNDSGVKDKDSSVKNTEKKNSFMHLNMAKLSRKKSNSLKD